MVIEKAGTLSQEWTQDIDHPFELIGVCQPERQQVLNQLEFRIVAQRAFQVLDCGLIIARTEVVVRDIDMGGADVPAVVPSQPQFLLVKAECGRGVADPLIMLVGEVVHRPH
jgi:hypothetical protein